MVRFPRLVMVAKSQDMGRPQPAPSLDQLN